MNKPEPPDRPLTEEEQDYKNLLDAVFGLRAEYSLGEVLIVLAQFAECEAEDEEVCEGHTIIAEHAARELRHLAESLASLEEDMFGPGEEQLDEASKKVLAQADELERQANDGLKT